MNEFKEQMHWKHLLFLSLLLLGISFILTAQHVFAYKTMLQETFAQQVDVSISYNTPFAILLCDVDLFKKINDNFGHLIGDKILAETTSILNKTIRETDIIGRWGGEEFLVICQETDAENALQLARRLRIAVESHSFISDQRQTIRIGVSSFMPKDSDLSMLARADRTLYSATIKKKGSS